MGRTRPLASIFLSYTREDIGKAERIAKALETAGHSVWWDRQLHAGERFSAEINKALSNADLVVVLWSRTSVESPWVQDEAAVGRDSRRLVPVLIDRVDPPLGFRQYHAVDLTKRGKAGSTDVLGQAIADRLGATRDRTDAAPAPRHSHPRRWLIPAAAVGLLLLVAVAVWVAGPFAAKSSHDVLITAADPGNAASQNLARSLALDLASLKVGPLATARIQPANGHSGSSYRAEVSLSGSNPKEVMLSLTSPQKKLLWSGSVGGGAGNETDLRQQAAVALGAVLACAFDPKIAPYKLNPESFSIYLDGCAKMSSSSGENLETIQLFRGLTAREPQFAPAWARLALLEFQALVEAPAQEKEEHSLRARFAFEKAEVIDRTLPQLFIFRAFMKPIGRDYAPHALEALDAGLRANPDDAGLQQARAETLMRLGRMNEALGSASRAVALDPLSPNLLSDYIFALIYTGRPGQAEQELAKAERRWPNSSAIKALRYGYFLRFGDPSRALRQLESGEGIARDQLTSQADDRWKLYLMARAQPNRGNIDRAIASFKAQYERGGSGALAYLMALGTFSQVDEAYRVMLSPAQIEDEILNSDIFFRPFMRSIRADPRFMRVASELGLVDYWRKSGAWPDFCNEPELPYDCRKEAAKYR